MRWISDNDRERLEYALRMLNDAPITLHVTAARRQLKDVLENIAKLEVETSPVAARIRSMSDSEHRKTYPERYRDNLSDTGHCRSCSRVPMLCVCM